MANSLLSGSVPVILDGETYALRYRAYAFIRYAEETKGGDLLADLRGMAADGLLVSAAEKEGKAPPPIFSKVFMVIRDILWAGLLELQPDVTRDQVSRMFGLSDLRLLGPAISAAVGITVPPEAPENSGRPTNPVSSSDGGLTNGLNSPPVSGLLPVSVPPNSTA